MDSGSERGAKRNRTEMEASTSTTAQAVQDDSSSDDSFGPSLPVVAPRKKKRKLPYESLYIAALPSSPRYSKSLMHRDQLFSVTFTPVTDFLITASIDGVVKFWKKTSGGVEFVKEFKAHVGEVTAICVSRDGRSFASAGSDGTVKVFDVVTFDLLAMIQLDANPKCICWIHKRGASLPLLAVSLEGRTDVFIYDGRCTSTEPIQTLKKLHRAPVSSMAFNNEYDCVISADENGMVEYWSPSSKYEKPANVFDMKSGTNLFEFKKAKSVPTGLSISADGKQFATFSFPDRKVRVFDFESGKLYRTYDESLNTIAEMQQAGTAVHVLEQPDFDKRMAVERELENNGIARRINIQFDESGHFILYGSLLGTKVINTLTNRVVKVYGRDEPFRALNLAIYQGAPDRKGIVTVAMAASDNPLLQEAEARDAMIVATGSGKMRFYMFTNDTNFSKSNRDVQNEKPRNLAAQKALEARKMQSGTSATIHTTYGDIHIKLFPEHAPRAVENFVTHARNGYYNNIIFHRIIRKFMIQTGDPLGDGTGGESIWGREFEDEFSGGLKHDKPYTVSMANAGKNTNGSQFFITTERTPWLDDKHTIFARATQGFDVIHRIENTKVHKERPEEDIKIINVTVV